MLRIAERRGYRNLGDLAAALYRQGRSSPTVYALMAPADLARMQLALGFSTVTGGVLTPELKTLWR